MPIVNGIIKAPVSIEDVRKALGERSTDLGTLCMSDKINIFARFKPLPITERSKYHTPRPLTVEDRNSVGNGIVSKYESQSSQTLTNFVQQELNKGSSIEQDFFEKSVWPEGVKVFYRLSDFIDVGSDGKPTGYGYKHDAKIHSVSYRFGNSIFSMAGRIFKTETVNVPEGSEYSVEVPDDSQYLAARFDESGNYDAIDDDPNSLSVMDVIVNSVFGESGSGHDITKNSKRGVAIFMHTKTTIYAEEPTWIVFGYVLNMGNDAGAMFQDFNFSSINLNSTVKDGKDGVMARKDEYGFLGNNTSTKEYATWSDLNGRCAVLEFYSTPEHTADIPIPGYGYEIEIVRQPSNFDTVDVPGAYEFIFQDTVVNIYNDGFKIDIIGYTDRYDDIIMLMERLRGLFSELILYVSSSSDGLTPASTVIDVLNDSTVDFSPFVEGDHARYTLIYPPTADITGTRIGYLALRGKKAGSTVYSYKVSKYECRY